MPVAVPVAPVGVAWAPVGVAWASGTTGCGTGSDTTTACGTSDVSVTEPNGSVTAGRCRKLPW